MRARRIEVPEDHRPQAMGHAVVVQCILDRELGVAVRVDRHGGVPFQNGHVDGVAIHRCGGGKDQLSHSAADHGIEQRQGLDQVVVPVERCTRARLAHQAGRSEVHDALRRKLAQHVGHEHLVADIAHTQRHASGKRIGMAGRQVVDHHREVPPSPQHGDHVGADVARASAHNDGGRSHASPSVAGVVRAGSAASSTSCRYLWRASSSEGMMLPRSLVRAENRGRGAC